LKIDRSQRSPNHQPRPADTPIDMLVLHYTGMPSAEAALARLCDPAAEVSAHYLIHQDGRVLALVDEDRRAWHAGQSFWRGQRDINSRSIGIELVNPGHEFGYQPFPDAQMDSLTRLAGQILDRHPIPARNLVGHADIAPQRKQDPGELFAWQELARLGIGLWPSETNAGIQAPRDVGALLRRWGYQAAEPAEISAAMVAFQRHFRPSCLDGQADAESLARLASLLAMVENSG